MGISKTNTNTRKRIRIRISFIIIYFDYIDKTDTNNKIINYIEKKYNL